MGQHEYENVWVVGRPAWFTQPRTEKTILEGRVTKVGRKYVYVMRRGITYKFDISTRREVYDGNYQGNYMGSLYPTKEEYDELIRLQRNKELVVRRTKERAAMFSLSQTERILAIIDENSYYPSDRE